MHVQTPRRRAIATTLPALLALVALAWPTASTAHTAAEKAGRGLAAMTTSFLEVPGNMVDTTERRGAAVGVPLGFVKGLGMIVVRNLVGVYEFVTAPFPVPAGYEPVIQPEYPWSYFDDHHGQPPIARN